MDEIAFNVIGAPRPMPRHRVTKSGGIRRNPSADRWQAAIRRAARAELESLDPVDALLGAPAFGTSPVAVGVHWRFQRPASHLTSRGAPSARWRAFPIARSRNDVDNLLKAVFDALGAWRGEPPIMWDDDSQVCDLLPCSKRYAAPGESPGVAVRIVRLG